MSTVKQSTAQYIEFIGKEVIGEFGGSYQNYETLGRTWRQSLEYSAKIEKFLMERTKLFVCLMEERDRGDLNLMYKLSYSIGDYLSKYLMKEESPQITRKKATEKVVGQLFFGSARLVAKFRSRYKKPLDTSNADYVASNPGVFAMYNFLQNGRESR